MNTNPTFEKIFEKEKFKLILFPEEDNVKRFKGLPDLVEFIKNEENFWRKYDSGNVKSILEHFNVMSKNLQAAITAQNADKFNTYFKRFLENALNRNSVLVYSETSNAKFIVDLYEIDPRIADGAYQFFTHENISLNLSIREHLKGLFAAFLFSDADETFLKKKNAEELSFSQIRSEYQETIDGIEKEYKDFLEKIEKDKNSFQESVTQWKDKKEKDFEENLTSKNTQFEEMQSQWKSKVENLENLYHEKLRLEGPAKYWEDLSKDYESKGKFWKNWALLVASILMVILVSIFFNFPKWLTPSNGGWNYATLRGSIILAVIISLGVYMVRFFIKFSTSAYHLSRDALERYQLTHSYLALIKEKILEPEDRTIILQALFSRSDTGLLKGDSTPAMPGNVISKLINKD